MIYIFIPFFILFALIFFIAKSDKNKSESNKAFSETSIKLLIAVFFSIVVSVIIALNADKPDSIGFGGFIYIIGPSIFGIVILYLFLISLWLWPKWAVKMGLACVLLNIGIGLAYMLFV